MQIKHKSREQKAVEAIMIASKLFGVTISVRYNFGRTVARYNMRWVVVIKDKVFYHDKFVEAIKLALKWATETLDEYKENSRRSLKL